MLVLILVRKVGATRAPSGGALFTYEELVEGRPVFSHNPEVGDVPSIRACAYLVEVPQAICAERDFTRAKTWGLSDASSFDGREQNTSHVVLLCLTARALSIVHLIFTQFG